VTGYFELNGLTDISYEEMTTIYYRAIDSPTSFTVEGIIREQRTNIVKAFWGANSSINSSASFANGTSAEVILLSPFFTYALRFVAYSSFFVNAIKLKKVLNAIQITGGNATNTIFSNCYSLEDVQLYKVERNTNIGQSPNLTLESVVYMVENAANTGAITITLHATAYARCQSDTTEYTYNSQTYTGILALATAHNITIASA